MHGYLEPHWCHSNQDNLLNINTNKQTNKQTKITKQSTTTTTTTTKIVKYGKKILLQSQTKKRATIPINWACTTITIRKSNTSRRLCVFQKMQKFPKISGNSKKFQKCPNIFYFLVATKNVVTYVFCVLGISHT